MADYTRDEAIADIAKVIAGLQVPMSMSMPLGEAIDPWRRLFAHLHTFGWTDAEQIEKELRAVLDEPTPKPERNIRLWLRYSSMEWRQAPGAYSSIASARRAKRKWLQHYEREGRSVTVYIQAPGDPPPDQDVN